MKLSVPYAQFIPPGCEEVFCELLIPPVQIAETLSSLQGQIELLNKIYPNLFTADKLEEMAVHCKCIVTIVSEVYRALEEESEDSQSILPPFAEADVSPRQFFNSVLDEVPDDCDD